MPIYEYRCPNGHTFERFQSMSAPPPEKCDVCAAAPLELVLYPIAIHYKGSGFYSTDYGKKGAAARKDSGDAGSSGGDSGASSGDSGSSSGDSGSSSGDSSAPKTDAKPAADKKPAKPSD